MRLNLGTAVGFSLTLMAAVPMVYADDYVCDGYCELGPNDEVDNLIVEEGATAVLNGTRVDANIFVRDGATLEATNIYVGGNIQSDGAASVSVSSSEINGDFQVDNDGAILLKGSFVGGSVQLFENNTGGGDIRVLKNTVEGNVQISSNEARRILVKRNVIDGNLQGESNTPDPKCKGNDVQGDTDGQFEGC